MATKSGGLLLACVVLATLVTDGDSVWLIGRRRRSCPRVNCHVSAWKWSFCTKSCGSGVQEGIRSILKHPRCGGASCPHLRTTRDCNTQCCPVSCEASDWKDWSSCSASCGQTGEQSRARTIAVKEICGGECNKVLNEKRACNRVCCPVNCKLGEWGNYTTCSASCGTHGAQLRSRDVLVSASCEGKCDSPTEETQACNRKCCPKECAVSEWGEWEKCSASCGKEGVKLRRRQVLQAASCGGTCPTLVEKDECNRECCPENCKVSGWTNYTACSASCGRSEKTRTRVILEEAKCGGECGYDLKEATKCNVPCCRQDCSVGLWGTWAHCSTSCGPNGTQYRTRSKTRVEQCNGTCSFSLNDTRPCSRVCCPVHCEMRWSPWSGCLCDGVERRYGTVTRHHACNGRPCPGKMIEERKCHRAPKCHHGVCGEKGKCHCVPGYFGKECHMECPVGLYGVKCSKICEHCPKRTCHHVTGQCVCPLMTYGKGCQHRLDCGRNYHCSSGSSVHSTYAQCFIRSTTTANHASCPRTHHLSRCHCYRGCHPKTIISSRYCHCECHPPSLLMFRRHYAAAMCCPANHNKPKRKPIGFE